MVEFLRLRWEQLVQCWVLLEIALVFFFLIKAFTLVLKPGFCDVNLLLDRANSKPGDI